MQLHSENNQLTTNLQTKAHVFTIHASAKAFKILSSNLYKFKIAAILRELSCNALDSHVDAGNDEPFVVHLPTQIEPFFSVEDFGTGMTPEQIGELYTGYFASSKTERNDQIGALGLGSKSPFAYTDMFTIDSVKEGIKSTYSAFLDKEGMPTYMLIKSEQTSSHSGVRITFPVPEHDFEEFCREAAIIFWAFVQQPKITGAVKRYAEYTEAFKNLKVVFEGATWRIYKSYPDSISRKYRSSRAFVRMGNILYPIETLANDPQFKKVTQYINLPLILDMPLGSCDINPSREELSYDQLTKDNIHEQLLSVQRELEDQAAKKCAKASTVWEAARAVREYYYLIFRNNDEALEFVYKGTKYKYGQAMTIDKNAVICDYDSGSRRRYYGNTWAVRLKNNNEPVSKLTVLLGHSSLIIVVGAKDAMSAYIRTRASIYCRNNSLPETDVRIVSDISPAELAALGNPPMIKYEDLPKVEVKRAVAAPTDKIRSHETSSQVDLNSLPPGIKIYVIEYKKKLAIDENYKGENVKLYKKSEGVISQVISKLCINNDVCVPRTVRNKIYIVPAKLFESLNLAKDKSWISFKTLATNFCNLYTRRYSSAFITCGREEMLLFYSKLLDMKKLFDTSDISSKSPLRAGLQTLEDLKKTRRKNEKEVMAAKRAMESAYSVDTFLALKLDVEKIIAAQNVSRHSDTLKLFHTYPMLTPVATSIYMRYLSWGYTDLNSTSFRGDTGNQDLKTVDAEHVKAAYDIINYVKLVDKSNGIS